MPDKRKKETPEKEALLENAPSDASDVPPKKAGAKSTEKTAKTLKSSAVASDSISSEKKETPPRPRKKTSGDESSTDKPNRIAEVTGKNRKPKSGAKTEVENLPSVPDVSSEKAPEAPKKRTGRKAKADTTVEPSAETPDSGKETDGKQKPNMAKAPEVSGKPSASRSSARKKKIPPDEAASTAASDSDSVKEPAKEPAEEGSKPARRPRKTGVKKSAPKNESAPSEEPSSGTKSAETREAEAKNPAVPEAAAGGGNSRLPEAAAPATETEAPMSASPEPSPTPVADSKTSRTRKSGAKKDKKSSGKRSPKKKNGARAAASVGSDARHLRETWVDVVFPKLFPTKHPVPRPSVSESLDGTLELDWGRHAGHVLFLRANPLSGEAFFRCSRPVPGMFAERCEESDFMLSDAKERAEVTAVLDREFRAERKSRKR